MAKAALPSEDPKDTGTGAAKLPPPPPPIKREDPPKTPGAGSDTQKPKPNPY